MPANFKTLLFIALLLSTRFSIAGDTLRVLFLGNSYTAANGLPQLVQAMAASAGDTLIYDSNTPGGYRLTDHATNSSSQSKIMQGGWDYVVLQGQSQEPVVGTSLFVAGGQSLYDQIKQYSPCAVVMGYMTWGRKNGDASTCSSFPVMCTYTGMDSSLRENYEDLFSSLNGELSPVSVVWRSIRQNYPAIDLYQPDESHPSLAGSYAAACTFYSSLFKKDPLAITFNSSLPSGDAQAIRNTVKSLVYDSLSQWKYKRTPLSGFNFVVGPGTNEINLYSVNQNIRQFYAWDLGDGTNSSAASLTHTYPLDGTYLVSLTTSNCDRQGWQYSSSDTLIQFCNHSPTIYSNGTVLCSSDTLWTQAADAYRWFAAGLALPDTLQYLSNFGQYGAIGFTVLSTSNSCSEYSVPFTGIPQASGFYFDAIGDPCSGDTVAFAVLHINGFLSGSESILWYKNDTLLTGLINQDTLLISLPGKYTCRVSDQQALCPLDTTSYEIRYSCTSSGISEPSDSDFFVYPNPVNTSLSLQSDLRSGNFTVYIFDACGRVVQTHAVSANTQIDVSALPAGLYFIRPEKGGKGVRFVKD